MSTEKCKGKHYEELIRIMEKRGRLLFKKIFALILSVTMIITMLPTIAFAENTQEDAKMVADVCKQLDWEFVRADNPTGNSGKSKITSNLYLPTEIEGYDGVSISWTSSNAAIASDGTVTRPANSEKDIPSIKLTATVKKGESEKTATIAGLKVLKITDNEVKLDKDAAWLQEVWLTENVPQEGLRMDLELPAKGGAGSSTISWRSEDPSVITESGEIKRADVGGEVKNATLTATLSNGGYNKIVQLEVKVQPWTETELAAKNAKIDELKQILDAVSLPEAESVGASNQASVTELVAANRDKIEEAYQQAKAAGAPSSELNKIDEYENYLNVETALRKLSKAITISIFMVEKNEDGTYTCDGSYYLPKTKVILAGSSSGTKKNDVNSALNGLKDAGVIEGASNASIKINGTNIVSKGDYSWHCVVNGIDRGKFSTSPSIESQWLDYGDSVVLYFSVDDDEAFSKNEYYEALPDSQAADYNFAEKEIADADWLTVDKILGENASKYSVKTNLTLPAKGHNGSEITWSTDNADVITTTGTVTQPDWSSTDATVRLTAQIGSLNKAQTKEFELIVKAQSISSDEKTLYYAEKLLTLTGIDAVTDDLNLPEKGFEETAITWESSNTEVIKPDGTVVRPAEDTQVILTAKLSVGNYTAEKSFSLTVLKAANADDEKLAYDKEKLTFDAIKGKNTSETSVKCDLHLPKEGAMGSQISWSSSDSTCLSNTGSVILGDEEKNVILTARLSNGNVSDEKKFRLTIPAATTGEKALAEAETAVKSLPDAVLVSRENAEEMRTALAEAKEKLEAAKKAGYTEADIENYDKITSIETKLSNLPVTMTFSIIGADVAGGKITQWKWFTEPVKLLVPVGSNLADVTEAMRNGYESVRTGSGQGYYGTIMGLSEREAGSASGWIFSGRGEGLNTNQGIKMSTATEGCVLYWAYIGDCADGNNSLESFKKEAVQGISNTHAIDYDLVPNPDRKTLESLIKQAEKLKEDDYRAYGKWAGTWETMQTALAEAKAVFAAEKTALQYEIDDAEVALSLAISALQPKTLDKATLKSLIDTAETLNEENYYKEGWDYFEAALETAKEVMIDSYAESGTVEMTTESLRNAMNRLISTNQADKTKLQAELDKVEMYSSSNYTLGSWQKLKEAYTQAQIVMDNVNASEEEVKEAVDMLQNAQKSLSTLIVTMQSVNEAVYQTIKNYQNTTEAWKVFDMILLGYGDQVNRQGYLIQTANLLESGKASITDLEKTAIVLTAMEYDVTNITTADGDKIDLIKEIMKYDFEDSSINAVVFALLAIDSGNYSVSDLAKENLIDILIATQNGDGGWPIYKGQSSDLDMTAMTIAALAPYNESGNSALDKSIISAFELLTENKDKLSGSPSTYKGNCNTTAMAIIACAALPESNKLLSAFEAGGLSHYVTADKQFGYMNNESGDDLATEQAVRAFTAWSKYKDTGKAVNIYRFDVPTKALTLPKAELPVISTDLSNQITNKDKVSFAAGAATPDGKEALVEVVCNGKSFTAINGVYTVSLEYGANYIVITATGKNGAVESSQYTVYRENAISKESISVSLTLLGDTIHGKNGNTHTLKEGGLSKWIDTTTITVDKNSTVGDVFSMVLIKYGYSFDGLANGYIKSITTPNGLTLAQLDNGNLSGWMYTVNGTHPNVGLNSYILHDGDDVVWHYTDDYTKEEGSEKWNTALEDVKTVTSDKSAGTTTSPTEVKVAETTNADGTKETVATVTVSADNQKEILAQAKSNKSKEIILQVSKDAVKDATKADVQLEKSFIESVANTGASLTVKTPFGDKTYTNAELKELAANATGKTISLEIAKSEEQLDDEANIAKAKELVGKISLTARSSKTSKKNIKVTLKTNKAGSAAISELKDLGYTVKYKYYRSTKKSSKYVGKITKTTKTFTNTKGVKGKKYYYKARVQVYDADGKMIAQTALKQCKYASRQWTK